MVKNLYECFIQRDCLEIQINPLVLTPDRKFVAANIIVRLDPDAIYRQQELSTLIDPSQMTIAERIAFNYDLKYVELDGNIGMVSNSAGLCMTSNDGVATYGGKSANFSDLGGAAIHEQIDMLLQLLNDDNKVRVIFINCYGGLMSMEKVWATL